MVKKLRRQKINDYEKIFVTLGLGRLFMHVRLQDPMNWYARKKAFYPELPVGMVYIPAGGFTMGLMDQDIFQTQDAKHKQFLSLPFTWIKLKSLTMSTDSL